MLFLPSWIRPHRFSLFVTLLPPGKLLSRWGSPLTQTDPLPLTQTGIFFPFAPFSRFPPGLSLSFFSCPWGLTSFHFVSFFTAFFCSLSFSFGGGTVARCAENRLFPCFCGLFGGNFGPRFLPYFGECPVTRHTFWVGLWPFFFFPLWSAAPVDLFPLAFCM